MRLSTPALAIALLSAAAPSYAQQLSVGVRGGLNFATADAEGSAFSQDVGSRSGFHTGILGVVDISKNFALQTEVIYSQKGFGTGNGSFDLSVDYIEFPVLAVIKIPGNISPHLYVGPVLGLESGCRVSSGSVEDVDCEAAITETLGTPRTRGADSGIMLGAGVTLDVGFGALLLDALYSYGLTDISEPTDQIESIQTRTFYLSAGFIRSIGATGG
jgi:hypothetical protein